jgi:hypothetical protein
MRTFFLAVVGVLALLNGAGSAFAAPLPPVPPADLTVHLSHDQSIPSGANGSYAVVITNLGGPTNGEQMKVTINLPAPLLSPTGTGPNSSGWTCDTSLFVKVVCTNTSNLAAGQSSRINLSVSALASIPTNQPLQVTATVEVPSDTNLSNNSATDNNQLIGIPVVPTGSGPLAFAFNATEGQPYAGDIAACPDLSILTGASNVSWGDGSFDSSVGTDGGAILGTHTYTTSGVYTLEMLCAGFVQEVVGPSVILVPLQEMVQSQAIVADAPLESSSVLLPQTPIVEGTGAVVTVASFRDANFQFAQPSDYAVDVLFQDGGLASCSVEHSAVGIPGGFDVDCFRFYPEAGQYPLALVEVRDIGGLGGAPLLLNGKTVQVSEAPLSVSGVDGAASADLPVSFTGSVATFTDGNSTANAADFTATLDWGDGSQPSAGQVTPQDGGFVVAGSHVYSATGTFTVSTTVQDGSVSASATSTIDISTPGTSTGCVIDCGDGGGAPSATPELDSILLFVGGLSGLAGYAMTRRRARK